MLEHFYVKARNLKRKSNSRNSMKAIRSGLDIFLSGFPQRKPFSIIRDKVFKPANMRSFENWGYSPVLA